MKGHPILGVISGFLFGLFLGIALFLYGVIPLSSDWLWILPLLGILLGLIMAAWAPFGKGPGPEPAVAAPAATTAPATSPPPPPAVDTAPVDTADTTDADPAEQEAAQATEEDTGSSEEGENTNSADESTSD